jgi:hypothetical protein
MKLIVIITLAISSFANATDINKKCISQFGEDIISQSSNLVLIKDKCLVQNYVTDTSIDMNVVNEFIKLERIIGEKLWDQNHVNNFQVINNNYQLNAKYISHAYLKSLAIFGINELGIYDTEDIFNEYWDLLDMYRHIETPSGNKVEKWITQKFADKKIAYEDYQIDTDNIDKLKKMIIRRTNIYDDAIANIIRLLTSSSTNQISVYNLLDNDNENVQDAQWVVVGKDYILVINKFWYL